MWGSKFTKARWKSSQILEFDIELDHLQLFFFYHFAYQKSSDQVLLSPYIKQVTDSRSLRNWCKTSHLSRSFLQNNILYVKGFVYLF